MTWKAPKIDWTQDDGVLSVDINRIESNTLEAVTFLIATGTAAAILLPLGPIADKYSRTFIAAVDNGGVATTINGLPFYKAGTTAAPVIKNKKAYTIWYDQTNNCFYLQACAEGKAIASEVKAGVLFSNEDDTAIVGTSPIKSGIVYTPAIVDQTISTGWEDGTCKVKGDPNHISANIKQGIVDFGVTGKFGVVDTTDATALTSDIVAGKNAYVNGTKVYGTATIKTLGGFKKVSTGYVGGTPGSTWGAGGQYNSYKWEIPVDFIPSQVFVAVNGPIGVGGWNSSTLGVIQAGYAISVYVNPASAELSVSCSVSGGIATVVLNSSNGIVLLNGGASVHLIE
jgi:hypothetical protein